MLCFLVSWSDHGVLVGAHHTHAVDLLQEVHKLLKYKQHKNLLNITGNLLANV